MRGDLIDPIHSTRLQKAFESFEEGVKEVAQMHFSIAQATDLENAEWGFYPIEPKAIDEEAILTRLAMSVYRPKNQAECNGHPILEISHSMALYQSSRGEVFGWRNDELAQGRYIFYIYLPGYISDNPEERTIHELSRFEAGWEYTG